MPPKAGLSPLLCFHTKQLPSEITLGSTEAIQGTGPMPFKQRTHKTRVRNLSQNIVELHSETAGQCLILAYQVHWIRFRQALALLWALGQVTYPLRPAAFSPRSQAALSVAGASTAGEARLSLSCTWPSLFNRPPGNSRARHMSQETSRVQSAKPGCRRLYRINISVSFIKKFKQK